MGQQWAGRKWYQIFFLNVKYFLPRDILTTNITQTWSTQALTGPLPGKFFEIAFYSWFSNYSRNRNKWVNLNDPPSGSFVTRSPTQTPAYVPLASRRAGSGMLAPLDSILTRTWLCSRWAQWQKNIDTRFYSSILMLMTRESLPVIMLTVLCLPQQGDYHC